MPPFTITNDPTNQKQVVRNSSVLFAELQLQATRPMCCYIINLKVI
jgi:hypothetical protein